MLLSRCLVALQLFMVTGVYKKNNVCTARSHKVIASLSTEDGKYILHQICIHVDGDGLRQIALSLVVFSIFYLLSCDLCLHRVENKLPTR